MRVRAVMRVCAPGLFWVRHAHNKLRVLFVAMDAGGFQVISDAWQYVRSQGSKGGKLNSNSGAACL
jgi:hypothetical protein